MKFSSSFFCSLCSDFFRARLWSSFHSRPFRGARRPPLPYSLIFFFLFVRSRFIDRSCDNFLSSFFFPPESPFYLIMSRFPPLTLQVSSFGQFPPPLPTSDSFLPLLLFRGLRVFFLFENCALLCRYDFRLRCHPLLALSSGQRGAVSSSSFLLCPRSFSHFNPRQNPEIRRRVSILTIVIVTFFVSPFDRAPFSWSVREKIDAFCFFESLVPRFLFLLHAPLGWHRFWSLYALGPYLAFPN